MRSVSRAIDANLNRAAEGLRCVEDVARFVLDDPALCERAKSARHDVRAAGAALAPGHAAERDAAGDPGREIKAHGEGDRPSLRALVSAAAKRAQEALRVLEEIAKVEAAPGPAATFERVRYLAYDLETALLARLGPVPPQWPLAVLITASLCARPWLEVARAAVAGGAACLQLREKGLADADLLDRARRLVDAVSGRAAVIINDRPDIAALAHADGVHLGQHDLPVAAARRIVGGHAVIGVSTSCLDDAERACRDGAGYVGLGPMYPSETKPKERLAGPAYLRAFLEHPRTRDLPHLAISGIDRGRARDLAALGCRGVAVSGAVCRADDPQRAAAEIIAAIRGASGPVLENP